MIREIYEGDLLIHGIDDEGLAVERIGQALMGLVPCNAWLLIYLGPEGRGAIRTVSTLSNEMQQGLARSIADSFASGDAKEIAKIVVPKSFEPLTLAELELIRALRDMPRDASWCHEMGFCVNGEGDYQTGMEKIGWGTSVYLAFKALGKERGEVEV